MRHLQTRGGSSQVRPCYWRGPKPEPRPQRCPISFPADCLPAPPPDIDECQVPPGEAPTCEHHCHNHLGGFYCSCRMGYVLHRNKHTCSGELQLEGDPVPSPPPPCPKTQLASQGHSCSTRATGEPTGLGPLDTSPG